MPTFAPEKTAAWTGGRWTRLPAGAIRGYTQDTRQLEAGQVFVALKTEKRDGHDYLGEAQKRGATAALVGRENPGVGLPQLVVADPLAAFQRIAREHRREFHGTVVGVTGSAGKTSTKDLLGLLLGGSATVLSTQANLNNHLGVPLTLTRLEPAIHLAAVIEAGIGGPGEMAPLVEMIEPDHAVVTLVAPAHLEKLATLEKVAAEKALLPAGVRSGGLQVFPSSCRAYEPFRRLGNPLVLVPENEDAAKNPGRSLRFGVRHQPDRTEVVLGTERCFTMRRVSSGMAQNASLALALASELGVGDAVLRSRLADWQPSKWRGEFQVSGEAKVYADFYNANPASMSDAIEVFHRLAPANEPRLYVLGSMEELGAGTADYHRQLGRTLRLRREDFLFAIGGQADALREGLIANGNAPSQIEIIADLRPVRERLAGFKGAVFLKASRRYQLETVLDPALAGAAH